MKTGSMMNSTAVVRSADAVPATHALVVAPAVGTLVLLFVAVGLAAAAVGALTGLAGHQGVTRHRRRA